MTTPQAEAMYLAQHQREYLGMPCAVWNPHSKPADELPAIYGFNNGGAASFLSAVALSEDGVFLGGHCCSAEGYMPHDLGVIEGTRPDRHANDYQKHYPDGYRMEFVPSSDIESHEGLSRAIALAESRG